MAIEFALGLKTSKAIGEDQAWAECRSIWLAGAASRSNEAFEIPRTTGDHLPQKETRSQLAIEFSLGSINGLLREADKRMLIGGEMIRGNRTHGDCLAHTETRARWAIEFFVGALTLTLHRSITPEIAWPLPNLGEARASSRRMMLRR